MYPDAPPFEPDVNVSVSGNDFNVRLLASSPSTQLDVHDGLATEVLVEAGPKNPGFVVQDTVVLWRPVSEGVEDSNRRKFTFNKQPYETKYGSQCYVRVTYRDARGSEKVNTTVYSY